jgi:hypothetical protein
MANTFPAEVSVDAPSSQHYVDWGAIVAGVFIAMAISSVFFAFGSAIGLSVTSFHPNESAPVIGLAIAAGLWLLWVEVSSFMGGAYVTGRMRRRIGDTKGHEVEMRDGVHGLIVWGVNIVIGTLVASWITLAGISGVVSTASNTGAMDYYAEKLMRSEGATAPATGSTSPQDTAQISRILTKNAAARTFDETDRSYLVKEISNRTGLAEPEAQKRLDETAATLRSQAETARRYAVLFAFMTAASFLVSAVGAWWAATTGGKHRDEGVDHSRYSRWW